MTAGDEPSQLQSLGFTQRNMTTKDQAYYIWRRVAAKAGMGYRRNGTALKRLLTYSMLLISSSRQLANHTFVAAHFQVRLNSGSACHAAILGILLEAVDK